MGSPWIVIEPKVSEKPSVSIFMTWLLDYIVKMVAASSSETLVLVYHTTWRDIPDNVIWGEL
jgi:hypothetical protein